MSSRDAKPPRSADPFHAGILALMGLAFALIPLARGELFFVWDNARLHFPQTVAIHDALRSGHLPEWSFTGGAGYPLLGEGNAALFYPIHLFLTWLFPPHVAFMLEIGLYLALAGVMAYLLLRTFRAGHLASLFAGLTWMFGGFTVVSVKNIAHLRSLWVLPLVFLLAERYVTSPRKAVWILLGGIAFGLQLLSGNPHYGAITAVGSGLYVLFRTWQRSWAQDESLRATIRGFGSLGALWVAAPAIGFGIAAIQIIPQMLHTAQSTRLGGMKFDFAMTLPASLRYLGQLFLPFAYEQGHVFADRAAWGGRDFNDVSYRGMYMGAAPLALAALAVWRHRRWPWPTWPLVALGLSGTALALGDQTPLYPALWSLPVFGSLRFSYRFLAIPAVCVACLAGLGMAHLVDAEPAERSHDSRRRWVRDAVPLVAVLGLAMALAVYLRVAAPQWVLVARDFKRGALISLAVLTGACVLVYGATVAEGRLRRALCAALVVFTLGDLMLFRARSHYAPTLKVAQVMTPPPAAEFLHRDTTTFRALSLEQWERAGPRIETIFEFLHAHASGLWGISSADPYESLMLRRYFMVHEALSWELLDRPGSAAQLQGYLAALNVKYVIAPRALTLNGWEQVFESPGAKTWRNPTYLPFAFLVWHVIPENIEERVDWRDRARRRQGRYVDMVRHWETLEAESQILDNVLTGSVDYARTAVLAGAGFPSLGRPDSAAIVIEGPPDVDAMRFTVTTSQPGFLVISNNYYPGWTATLNGAPVPIHRADWVVSGVFIPAGRSEVALRFTTPGLWRGLAVSLVTLVLVVMALAQLRGWPRGRATRY